MMKNIRNLFVILVLALTGCADYLNVVPEKDVETIESIFETRTNADRWLAGLYGKISKNFTSWHHNVSYLGADEFTADISTRNELIASFYWNSGFKIAEGLQMSQSPYGDIWNSYYGYIRDCNTFIENIDRVYNMKEREKKQWKAEVKALKAWLYFELIRYYGPIVLVPENLDVDLDIADMKQERLHVDTCFKAVVDLVDDAVENGLLSNAERSYDRSPFFCRESALALKVKALLYAASPLFNGNEFYSDFTDKQGKPLFSKEYDPEKWRLAAEAADMAVQECEDNGFELYAKTVDRGSEFLNTMRDIEYSVHGRFVNPEMLLEWKNLTNNPALHEMFFPLLDPNGAYGDEQFGSKCRGAVNPSMRMVEMYYTENGLPIDADINWDYSNRYKMAKESAPQYTGVVPLNADVLQLHLRREPRFYASVAADRTHWRQGPVGGEKDNNLLVEVRQGEEFGTKLDVISSTSFQNTNGYFMKKYLWSDYMIGAYGVSPDETMPIIRLAELYLMQAEAWNEYGGPSQKVYDALNKVRERAGIPDVETAWKLYSNNPGKITNKEGMRDIIRQETNIELAFEGHRFFNLRRWKIAHEELNKVQTGWNILGKTAQMFYNNFEGPVTVWSKCKFTAPRDYLFPLKAEEVLISGLVQNPGW